MRKRVASVPAFIINRLIAVTVLTVLQTVVVLAAGSCITEPNLRITQGGHWYYYFDRVRNRKCWFLQHQDVGGSSKVSPQAQSSGLARPSTTESWISSLAPALAPASVGGSQRLSQSDVRTGQPSFSEALRGDAALPKEQPKVIRHSDPDGKPPGDASLLVLTEEEILSIITRTVSDCFSG
jgi:hypothetical protein